MKNVTVLVTGSGGDIGQSIVKILQQQDFVKKVVGTDIHDKHPSVLLCDAFYTVNRVTDSRYADEISRIIHTHEIDLLIPVAEPELRQHLKADTYSILVGRHPGLKVVLPNKLSLAVGFDKLRTAEYLKAKGIPTPTTVEAGDNPDLEYPFVLKDRYGSGSKVNHVVTTNRQYVFYQKEHSNLIQQQFLPGAEGEFTCGLYRSNGVVRSITFKRELMGGYSNYGVVENSEKTTRLLEDIATALDLEGAINVQFRRVNGVDYVFEINPRFSSTVLFRHLFGFSDLIWSIMTVFEVPLPDYRAPANGGVFYKGFNEYITPAK
ncbi:carbamoyl-phosphate synthase large subunit [Lewinella marina]|uniref:ATP-dependent carboxylate-amine ligase n=1 Tax=Neolewinella marina TaxID=438751 RepID=A0A2G0CBW0_9BACT|nr:ATP-grasp domain-containing protein [Neolewinella marina]NJB86660.1 carbamoyl-phosphate synthase large subunit [Neolewinella marina]PHK97468.1 ATP-dependent carboxylate-amine ligase [Neolewinella marina]